MTKTKTKPKKALAKKPTTPKKSVAKKTTTNKKVERPQTKEVVAPNGNLLNRKVSFFTGSLVLITAFVIAASAIPSYKKENQSALEVLFMTFVSDSDLTEAYIEAENFRIEIYKKKLQEAEAQKARAQ